MIGGGAITGGGGATWAKADDDASATLSTKAAATVFTLKCPALDRPVRKGLEAQRIKIIPRRSAARRK